MTTPVYTTATDTAALGWDELLSPAQARDGLVLATGLTPAGATVRLKELFSEEAETGLEWVIEHDTLSFCDDECRYEGCDHDRRVVAMAYTKAMGELLFANRCKSAV